MSVSRMKQFAALTLALMACGGGSSNSQLDASSDSSMIDPNDGLPNVVLKANEEDSHGDWHDLGLADFSCLGTPTDDRPTGIALTANVLVVDAGNLKPIVGGQVVAFPDADADASFGPPQTTSMTGQVMLYVPAGVTRIGYRVTGGMVQGDLSNGPWLDTYTIGDLFGSSTSQRVIDSWSHFGAELGNAVVNHSPRTPGTGSVWGRFQDCSGHPVSGFVVVVSSMSGTRAPVPDLVPFYYSVASNNPDPSQTYANFNGKFMTVEGHDTKAFLQIWGFISVADRDSRKPTLVGELEIPMGPDTITEVGVVRPKRS